MSRPLQGPASSAPRLPARQRAGKSRVHTIRPGEGRRPLLRPGPYSVGTRVDHIEDWRTTLRNLAVELDAIPAGPVNPAGYTGWVYALDAGPIQVIDVGSDPAHVARTRRLINRSPVDVYHLSVALRPSWSVAAGRRTLLRTGDAVLVDGTAPWAVGPADVFGHVLAVNVPRAAVRRDLRAEPPVLGHVIAAENPALRVLLRVVTELARGTSTLPSSSLGELGYSAYELLLSTVRAAADGGNPLADARSPRSVLVLRMREFVANHLDDPALSLAMLADAFHVSPRSVELAFHEHGLSPGRFIREARMAGARRMLADPRQRHRPIAAIAREVGFEDPSVFARTFRTHFDMTPREYRYLCAGM